MDEKKLARDELIGLKVKIKDCKDPSWIGKSGIVVNETKKTFLLEIEDEKKTIAKDLFLKEVHNFFNRNKINIIETNTIKKNTEIDFIVELQTTIGNVRYFCKTKNKKKINEGDLSSALLNAQSKSLPLLFLTTGKISKKTKEQLNTDFKNIVYREI